MAVEEKPSTPQGRKVLSLQHPPAWSLPALLIAFVMVFLGERVLAGTTAARIALSGIGSAIVVAITALRWIAVQQSSGERRRLERALAILYTLSVVALIAYYTTALPFIDWLPMSKWSSKARQRYEDGVTCVWISLWVLSILPTILGEIALYPMRDAVCVEWRRVRNALLAGITLACAAIYGSLFTFFATQLNLRADFSYFRTARPTEATRKLAASVPQPLKVLAFFPPVNEVGNEASAYLYDLQRSAPKLEVQILDRLTAPQAAKDARVTQDGVVVLQRGEQRETLTLGSDLKQARGNLKKLDVEFRKTLNKVLRTQRTAYWTVGHGELNDTKPSPDDPGRGSQALHEVFEHLHYRVKDLGMVQGLGKEIPEDATVVLILGPTEPFLPEELSALERYLARGGHLLIALEPESKTNSEALAGLAGLTFSNNVLCNDSNHATRRHNESDRSIIFTNRFSVHPSVSTLSRLGSRIVFFAGAGSLDKKSGAEGGLKIDFIARSLADTFADTNRNFLYESASEKRNVYNLAAAASRAPLSPPATANEARGPAETRLVVVADADTFSDTALASPALANGTPQFVVDIVRWLGGEEALSGVEESSEDVRIEHAKQKDRVFFYLTIFGAPALVLCLGIFVPRRSRVSRRKSP